MKRVRDPNRKPGSPVRRHTRKCTRNIPFHGLWCHLGWGANTEKLQWMYGICTEIIFTKYNEEVQVLTIVNEFLRYWNPSNQHYANYHDIRSLVRRFIIRIYGRRSNVVPHLRALFSVEWVISTKLFKVVANVGNPPLCTGVTAVPSGPKSHTFTVILAVFAPQPRWRHKPWKGLFLSYSDVNAKIITVLKKS